MVAKWEDSIVRREYHYKELNDDAILEDPLALFQVWLEEFLLTSPVELAMVLSTVDQRGLPDSRVVLFKGIESGAFLFYTNYDSRKGMQLQHTPYAALNFYWPVQDRQIRIRGPVTRATEEQSNKYFAGRPRTSQISTCISYQSKGVANRKILEKRFEEYLKNHPEGEILRPTNWGGFCILPEEIEFWQGRPSRLHDRIQFTKKNHQWAYKRLEP